MKSRTDILTCSIYWNFYTLCHEPTPPLEPRRLEYRSRGGGARSDDFRSTPIADIVTVRRHVSNVPKADIPLSASNLPTAEVNQRPLLIDPKAIEVAPRRMLPKAYVRSLGLRRVVVPVDDTLHAHVDEKSAY